MYTEAFENRHIGPNEKDEKKMLASLGIDSIADLLDQTLPASIRLPHPLNLPKGISEYAFAQEMQTLSEKNELFDTYIGLGYHPTITPAVIQRNIFENPGWYTAYTPYQAEIAQGRLEALFNFQSMVSDLTGMPLANASLLDEATAAAEAMSLLWNSRTRAQIKAGADRFFVDENVLPQTLAVLQTRAQPLGIAIVVGNPHQPNYDSFYFGAFFQYPGKRGALPPLPDFIATAKQYDIATVVAADLLSLTLLEAPGQYGVDVVVGTTQRFGIPLGYGGPHAAFFATQTQYKRQVPGRIIGQTKDLDGNLGLRMALQTREQHIKRDRATSNICTAQVLLAVMAGMYAVYHGPKGLKNIAKHIHQKAYRLAQQLQALGFPQENDYYFDTLCIKVKGHALRPIAEKHKINFCYFDEHSVGIAINETTSEDQLQKIVAVFEMFSAETLPQPLPISDNGSALPATQIRSSPFLTHKVFQSYHSETALMRYIKSLEQKDLALNFSMIPLGSCTMKLNAAATLLPLSHPKWNQLHPFVPAEQAQGYQQLLQHLSEQLNVITGFAATSLQPNSGAQGEYAGLMVIKAYHEAQQQGHRNICLIPASAHGTNPASAVMAGMEVVVVQTDTHGNIDWDDIQEKTHKHKNELAALMITYPSTHGVFESKIQDITALIHQHGGQVYMDGANMNAQVGLTSPAQIGADVCHLNLHKTFAIPHGGGGPGVGPICVAEHLAPFLPSHPLVPTGGNQTQNTIAAAPYGSALVCLISYGYIRMLGGKGLQQATAKAILNANYIQKRLEGAYEVLYKGEQGRAAHELIIDCRPFKAQGIEVVDIAKRLIDYGFHAPTVSFPVAGTMMIEPTESENLEALDQFCNAMISIRMEMASENEADHQLLRNAPHTLEQITQENWPFPYSRQKAAFPLDFVRQHKFWPSVRRMDEAYGDRNLICSCTPIEEYVKH